MKLLREYVLGLPTSRINKLLFIIGYKKKEIEVCHQRSIHPLREGKVQGILNASSKICSLVVNGQSFLVTDGSLLNLF